MSFCCGWLLAVAASAQSDSADLSGTVMDQSDAVVAHARVDITNSDTDLRRTIFTSAVGSFSAPALPPGRYTLRAAHDGYQITQSQMFTLNAGDRRTVIVKLSIGGIWESVTVSASQGMTGESGSLANLTTADEMRDLPSMGRQFGDKRTQAFVLDNPGTTWSRTGWIAVNGGRNLDNTPIADGIMVMSQIDGGGGTVVQSGMAGTEEIGVQLANSPAEFPRPSAYSTITKGGENTLHGSLFYWHNDKLFNARDYFAATLPNRLYNDIGISLGGAIRKDVSFFFFDGEHSRESADTVINADVAPAEWRTGNFAGVASDLKNPYTGSAISSQQLPAELIHPVARRMQNLYYPLPNFGSPKSPAGNYRALLKPGLSGQTNFDSFDVRLDHIFNSANHAYASFNYINLPLTSWQIGSLPPFGFRHQFRLGRSGQVSWVHVFFPSSLNELRFGFTRQKNSIASEYVGDTILQTLGLPDLGTTDVPTVPILTITGLTSATQVPYFLFANTSRQLTDNFSWTRGSHLFRFGFTGVSDMNAGFHINGSVYGSYTFTGVYTGFPYADFLAGLPQTTTIATPAPKTHLVGDWLSVYAQDQFKITPHMTLSYGLRWEVQQPYSEKNGLLASFDPHTGSIVVPDRGLSRISSFFPRNLPVESASRAGYPAQSLLKFHPVYLYPRFGFSWQPFNLPAAVLRGGYGVYGNSIYGAVDLTGGPFAPSQSFSNAIIDGKPLLTLTQPFSQAANVPSYNVAGINPNARIPILQQWNLTAEWNPKSLKLSASYIGSKASNLMYSRNINQPPPSTVPFQTSSYVYPLFRTISWADNGGTENYNSLQVVANKAMDHGFFFKAGWTWAKDLTDTQDQTSDAGPMIQNAYSLGAEYGNATNVSRHRVFVDAICSPRFHPPALSGMPTQIERAFFDQWTLAFRLVAGTGPYFNPVFSGIDTSNTNTTGNQRPDIVAGVSTFPLRGRSRSQWFNPEAFKIPGCPDSVQLCSNPIDVGRFGNAGMNTIQGPSYNEVDLGLIREIRFQRSTRLRASLSIENLLNHPNFATPSNMNIISSTAGRITSTYAEMNGSTARQIELGVKIAF